MKTIASTVYILFLIMLTGSAIGTAAKAGYLIPAAVPFALVLILILRFMNPKLERIAWAAFTVWLGSTYVQLGNPIEYGLFFAYIALALLGVLKSPYFLVVALPGISFRANCRSYMLTCPWHASSSTFPLEFICYRLRESSAGPY